VRGVIDGQILTPFERVDNTVAARVDLSRSLGVEGLVISISRLVTMRVFADRLVGCRHQSHKWEFCLRKQLSSKKNSS
jgi:hypothetical protein